MVEAPPRKRKIRKSTKEEEEDGSTLDDVLEDDVFFSDVEYIKSLVVVTLPNQEFFNPKKCRRFTTKKM